MAQSGKFKGGAEVVFDYDPEILDGIYDLERIGRIMNMRYKDLKADINKIEDSLKA